MRHFKQLIHKIIEPHSTLSDSLKYVASLANIARAPLFSSSDYSDWISKYENKNPDVKKINSSRIRVSIVTSFWNTKKKYIDELIVSLKQQSETRGWEFIMVDVSTSTDVSDYLIDLAREDSRFKYIKADNVDISTNTNIGILESGGDYIAFVDHDDRLAPIAMYEVIDTIKRKEPDLIYSDEDKINDNGKIRHSPYFKPNWSPYLLLNTNYINHLTVMKKDAIQKVGYLRPEYNGSQDYDLLLRVTSNLSQNKIVHIPKILYHWREAEGSTARNHTNKKYAFVAGQGALQERLNTKGSDVKVQHIEGSPGFYKEVFKVDKLTTIAIFIDSRYIKDLEAATTTKNRIIFNPDNMIDIEYAAFIKGGYLPTSHSWLDELVGLLQASSDIKTVSPLIVSSDLERVIDAGVVARSDLAMFDSYTGLKSDEHTPTGGVTFVRETENTPDKVYLTRANSLNSAFRTIVWSHVIFRENITLESN